MHHMVRALSITTCLSLTSSLNRKLIIMALLFRPVISNPISISVSKSVKMANQNVSLASSSSSNSSSIPVEKTRKLPILLFDIMDTVVRDPFYQDIPAFFGMTFKELIECKHPHAWVDFEKGLINEMELARIFFKDGRALDLEGLKECIKNGYSYIDGVEALLCSLKQHNYEMHAFTNYPNWYTMIEDKLKVSTYMSWTFCSCKSGKRKPEADSYLDVLRHLGVEPASCIFIDDRMVNVEAARNAGIVALQFKDAASLQRDLSQLGVETSCFLKDGTANKNHQDLIASMREQLP